VIRWLSLEVDRVYSPKEYWTSLAASAPSVDSTGLAPVLHPAAPSWFNKLIDTLQFRAFRRALSMASIPPGAQVLDVGCGTGRWVRRYEEFGFHATGVDAAASMLRIARELGTTAPLVVGEAYRLPFLNARFDLVSDITVVQHIPASLQPQALSEMMRVIRPGGCLILMELIRGEGSHVFPRRPQDWIEQGKSCGAKLVGWFGQEFFLLDRFFVGAAQSLSGRKRNGVSSIALSSGAGPRPMSAARGVYWALRHVTAQLSAWGDPVAEKVCPARFATHGVFVLRK